MMQRQDIVDDIIAEEETRNDIAALLPQVMTREGKVRYNKRVLTKDVPEMMKKAREIEGNEALAIVLPKISIVVHPDVIPAIIRYGIHIELLMKGWDLV